MTPNPWAGREGHLTGGADPFDEFRKREFLTRRIPHFYPATNRLSRVDERRLARRERRIRIAFWAGLLTSIAFLVGAFLAVHLA